MEKSGPDTESATDYKWRIINVLPEGLGGWVLGFDGKYKASTQLEYTNNIKNIYERLKEEARPEIPSYPGENI